MSDEGSGRKKYSLQRGGGLKCPTCGCADLGVYYTRQITDATRRRRTCRNCGRKVTTSERIVG